jgi:hypothetical protein
MASRRTHERREMSNPWAERVATLEAEVKVLEERLRAKHAEAEDLEASLKEELKPQMEEVVRFATEQGHTWPHYRMAFGPNDRDEERLIADLAEMFASGETRRHRREAEDIERELRRKKKELKKDREFTQSWFGS